MRQNFTFILLFSLIFSSGKSVSSCIYKAVGDNVVIPLGDEELPQNSQLTWTHDKIRVYYKKGSNVKIRELTVDRYGSLILENIQKSNSGEYKAEAFNLESGQLIKKTEARLCVQEPVPEPSVKFQCVEEGVNLTCTPMNSSEVFVSWTKNGEKTETTRAVVHVSSSELKSGDTFSCTLSNMISKKTAKDVQPACSDTGKSVSSCIYKAVGDNVVIPLGDEELPQDSDLTWKHNKIRVYYKQGSNVKKRELTVDRYGSLILENIQKSNSGEYKAEAFNVDGKLIKKTEARLCVQEPVPEPSVKFQCVEEGVNLTCTPMNSSEVFVSWTKNGEKSKTTHAVLHVSSSELKSGDTFSCTLSNMISKKTAKDVQPACSDTGVHATNANEDKEKEENGNNENKDDEEAEFRLVSLMPDHENPPDEPYMQRSESQRPSKSQHPLPPLPCPRGPPAVEPQ